jgi:hypothetical protein
MWARTSSQAGTALRKKGRDPAPLRAHLFQMGSAQVTPLS